MNAWKVLSRRSKPYTSEILQMRTLYTLKDKEPRQRKGGEMCLLFTVSLGFQGVNPLNSITHLPSFLLNILCYPLIKFNFILCLFYILYFIHCVY